MQRQFVAERPNKLWDADISYVDALEQAVRARGGARGVIHHSDRGSECLSIHYTERQAEGGEWNRRLLEPIDNISPAERETAYYSQL